MDQISAAEGPELTTPEYEMAAATWCDPSVYPGSGRQAVLLIHGTGSTPSESWGWNYQIALANDGYGVCTVTLPGRATGSVTDTLEYAVYAARFAYAQSGQKIAILGHSQGGMIAAWIGKFWPDVAKHATDIISIAGPLQGTQLANNLCLAGSCTPLAWQQAIGSEHTTALVNAPYQQQSAAFTSLGSTTDTVIFPQPLASTLPGAFNVMLQSVCPLRMTEHGLLVADAIAYELVLDALTHNGGAVASRISPLKCLQTNMSDADMAAGAALIPTILSFALGAADVSMFVTEEPPLPAYAAPYGNPGAP